MVEKQFNSAPLPFQGQKRKFAKEFAKVLQQYPDDTVFVDLFGGSGLLSHITKRQKPNATVVYNDFDNYRQRLAHISQTNELLAAIREILKDVPRSKMVQGELRQAVIDAIKRHEKCYGYVDYITLSSSIMFSMKYCTNIDDLEKQGIYNRVRRGDFATCDGYLDGLTVVSADYKQLVEQYKDVPNVVFIIDPPYLSTDTASYNMNWQLSDYLDVLLVLFNHSFIYFTSNKSSIIELCEWIARNSGMNNPFERCNKVEVNTSMNYNSAYTDIMLYTTL